MEFLNTWVWWVIIWWLISILTLMLQNRFNINIKKIELTYQHKIPVYQSLVVLLSKVSLYVNAVQWDFSWSDFWPTTYSYSEESWINIGFLSHTEKVSNFLTENSLFISKEINNNINNFLEKFWIICSIELHEQQEQCLDTYKECWTFIDKIINDIRLELKLPL